ncbi:MAG TPA: VWA domain-containing protein [Bryobacteraceae bacterium]|jgi:Ca-activated chloride channel family protein|nr:VWA domain-containing protein [Bryobacteraceae bacterium]
MPIRIPLLLFLTIGSAFAQTQTLATISPIPRPRENLSPRADFTTDTQLVIVPATVTDRRGAVVTGLAADSFIVSQDNSPQRIVSFGEEDTPVALGVVLDTSGSMQHVLENAKSTLQAFFRSANPEDEACLYTVSSTPTKNSEFTPDFNTLLARTMFLNSGGSTALVDSIYSAIELTRKSRLPRKAILVISDGMDNHSRYSKSELSALAMESDMQIYSITVYDPPRNKKPIELAEERNGLAFLQDLSRRTGGVQLVVHDPAEFDRAAADIGRAMRDQYLIGYAPDANATDAKWHAIKVRLNLPGVSVSARPGFYAR